MCGPIPNDVDRDLEYLRKLGREQQQKEDDAAKKKHLSDVAFVNQNGRGK
jgi:hypothetical protein